MDAQENQTMTRVGPGTPAGETLRRYWLPINFSDEVKTDEPKIVRRLAEDLLLFRDEFGRVGLTEPVCPHRGTSLEYGWIEAGGIRCCYHGWVYDVTGRCIEQPGEPAGSNFKDKDQAQSLPDPRARRDRLGLHEIYFTGRLFAYTLGLKEPKFVTGFGNPEMLVALAQGEVDGRSQVAESIERTPEWIDKGAVDFHAILETPGVKRHPRFAQLPTLESFAKSGREQKVLLMHRAFRSVGTPYMLPPATPKERVDIIADALRATFRDPAFLSDFKKQTGAEATPITADEQTKALREIPRDKEVIELFKKLVGADPLPQR